MRECYLFTPVSVSDKRLRQFLEEGKNNDHAQQDSDDDHFKEDGLGECLRSIVSKLITEKPIHKHSLHSALANIWRNPHGSKRIFVI